MMGDSFKGPEDWFLFAFQRRSEIIFGFGFALVLLLCVFVEHEFLFSNAFAWVVTLALLSISMLIFFTGSKTTSIPVSILVICSSIVVLCIFHQSIYVGQYSINLEHGKTNQLITPFLTSFLLSMYIGGRERNVQEVEWLLLSCKIGLSIFAFLYILRYFVVMFSTAGIALEGSTLSFSYFSLISIGFIGLVWNSESRIFWLLFFTIFLGSLILGTRAASVACVAYLLIYALAPKMINLMGSPMFIILFFLSIFAIYPIYFNLVLIANNIEFKPGLLTAITSKSIKTRFVWLELWPIIKTWPYFGLGSNIASQMLSASTILHDTRLSLSSHSSYLGILLRLGFVGLSLIALLKFFILQILSDAIKHQLIRRSFAFVCALLVNGVFMQTLWFSNLSFYDLICWVIFGISMGQAIRLKNNRCV